LDNCKEKLAVAIAAAAVSTAATTATPAATTSAATVTASATPTTSAATVTTTTTAASAATFTLRAGFVDHKSAAQEILAIESGDHLFGFGVVANFSETKTAWLPRETIAEQGERIGLHADFRE
jgi:hypothetical protein